LGTYVAGGSWEISNDLTEYSEGYTSIPAAAWKTNNQFNITINDSGELKFRNGFVWGTQYNAGKYEILVSWTQQFYQTQTMIVRIEPRSIEGNTILGCGSAESLIQAQFREPGSAQLSLFGPDSSGNITDISKDVETTWEVRDSHGNVMSSANHIYFYKDGEGLPWIKWDALIGSESGELKDANNGYYCINAHNSNWATTDITHNIYINLAEGNMTRIGGATNKSRTYETAWTDNASLSFYNGTGIDETSFDSFLFKIEEITCDGSPVSSDISSCFTTSQVWNSSTTMADCQILISSTAATTQQIPVGTYIVKYSAAMTGFSTYNGEFTYNVATAQHATAKIVDYNGTTLESTTTSWTAYTNTDSNITQSYRLTAYSSDNISNGSFNVSDMTMVNPSVPDFSSQYTLSWLFFICKCWDWCSHNWYSYIW